MIYEAIGRLVVRYVWRRYATQIKLGIVGGLVLLLIGGYLASRAPVEEG